VNHDGTITPLDALIAINEINLNGIRELPVPGAGSQGPPPYFDVSGDDWLTAHDVLLVVNYLNANGAGPVPTGASSESPNAAAGWPRVRRAEGESLPDFSTRNNGPSRPIAANPCKCLRPSLCLPQVRIGSNAGSCRRIS
jgi:hypothetical protein